MEEKQSEELLKRSPNKPYGVDDDILAFNNKYSSILSAYWDIFIKQISRFF